MFSKISVGRSKHKTAKFTKSRDVNTTSSFGFIQPLFKMEMLPHSKAVIKQNSFVRCMPLVLPTFGRVQARFYHQFVPMHELCKQFENIIAKTSYNTTSSTIIPTDVAQTTIAHLTALVLGNSSCTAYQKTSGKYVPVATAMAANEYSSLLSRLNITASYVKLPSYSTNIKIEGADYVIGNSTDANPTTILCFKFNKLACNLRKILIGLGYQLNIYSHDYVSILPIYAYYKAWFDIFAIKRSINWESTFLYQLIMLHYNSNVSKVLNSSSIAPLFKDFFYDLASSCYFVDDNDYISVHQITPSLSVDQTISGNAYNSLNISDQTTTGANNQPYTSSGQLTQLKLQALKVLNTLVNKRSIFGKQTAKFLKDEYGLSLDEHYESNNIGSSSLNIMIGDVMATNDSGSDYQTLGTFAGQGQGQFSNEVLKYETKTWGFWISLFTIVPTSGYCQGIDPENNHINYDTFYHPEFDSLGYQISKKSLIFACNDECNQESPSVSESFGFVPRYLEYKTNANQNILNGDLSRRSTRDNMLPFTIDRFISPKTFKYTIDGSAFTLNSFVPVSFPAEPSVYRIIFNNHLNNFDRIFANYNQNSDDLITDNFVCHNFIDIEYYAPMIPISESYDVDSFNDDKQTVQKA